jgi:hypothetical protein
MCAVVLCAAVDALIMASTTARSTDGFPSTKSDRHATIATHKHHQMSLMPGTAIDVPMVSPFHSHHHQLAGALAERNTQPQLRTPQAVVLRRPQDMAVRGLHSAIAKEGGGDANAHARARVTSSAVKRRAPGCQVASAGMELPTHAPQGEARHWKGKGQQGCGCGGDVAACGNCGNQATVWRIH